MQIEFDRTRGCFDFITSTGSRISGASAWVSYRQVPGGKLQRLRFERVRSSLDERSFEDIHGSGTLQVISCPASSKDLELEYRIKTYPGRQFILLQIFIRNASSYPVYLDECCLLDSSPANYGEVVLGDPAQGLSFLKIGWHGWDFSGARCSGDRDAGGLIARLTRLSYTNPATSPLQDRGIFSSEGWAVLSATTAGVVAGFASTGEQFGQVYACTRPYEHSLTVKTQMDGIRLDPGEGIFSEWGYLQFVDLPHSEPQADYIEAVARQMHARLPATPPPLIWTHWYQYFHDIDEQLYLKNLDVLEDQSNVFPCSVTELDDGYQAAWGDWLVTNKKFPHGLEWLAQQVRQRGFIPGLWLAPFAVQATSHLAKKHPDWLVKNTRGNPARAGFLYNMFIYSLDLTHPQVLDHLRSLAYKLNQEWGYRMLKIDFLNAAAIPGIRLNPKVTRAQALRSGLEAIREGAGDDTFLLGCGCPFGPAIGLVDAMRIGPDTAPSWSPYFNWMKWAGPLLRSNPNMPSLRNAFRNTLNLSSLHQRWWWNDPDCLLVRESDSQLTNAEVQSEVTLVGLSGGLIVSSDDFQQVSQERMRWISALIPNLGHCGLPLDLLKLEMPQVYQVKIEHDGQVWQLAGLFNWSDQPADLTLNFSQLGYSSAVRLHVFDFWQQAYQQLPATKIEFHTVPPHGCKLLRVCEVGEAPQLVGDTLHISMGAEIKRWVIHAGEVKLELIDMGRKVEGKVWIWTGEELLEKLVSR